MDEHIKDGINLSDPLPASGGGRIRETLQSAIEALEAVEWGPDINIASPTCRWCGGYMRSPAMDQDYYGKAGHRPTCLRQLALAGLHAALSREVGGGSVEPAETIPIERLTALVADWRFNAAEMEQHLAFNVAHNNTSDDDPIKVIRECADQLAALLTPASGD